MDSISKFTVPAAKLWDGIPTDTRKMLLSNVWCGNCRHEVTITKFSGAVKVGDLLLVGKCSECHGDVARLIELKGSTRVAGVGETGHDLLVSKETLASTQALGEAVKLAKECDAAIKKFVRLTVKERDGTITNEEKVELDRIKNQEVLKKITQKLSEQTAQLLEAHEKKS
jgi:hypothetical protein